MTKDIYTRARWQVDSFFFFKKKRRKKKKKKKKKKVDISPKAFLCISSGVVHHWSSGWFWTEQRLSWAMSYFYIYQSCQWFDILSQLYINNIISQKLQKSLIVIPGTSSCRTPVAQGLSSSINSDTSAWLPSMGSHVVLRHGIEDWCGDQIKCG